jgi:hypothetical protein
VNESRSAFIPDGNSSREGLPEMLVRRALWTFDASLPPMPRMLEINPSAINVVVAHAVASDKQTTRIDTAWQVLFRELGSTMRTMAQYSESRQENATVRIARGPSYWHTLEAGGIKYSWISGQESCALTDAWRTLWNNLAGGRKVEAFMERHQWDPLGLSLYVTPKESLKLGKWYLDRLLPVLDELCAEKT